jgi:uncharacterized membrane protein YccF (DUF307 family)
VVLLHLLYGLLPVLFYVYQLSGYPLVFNVSRFVLWPFGKEIEVGHFGAGGLLFNIIWLIFFGWGFAIAHLIIGVILCITIVGIPFGIQHFKFALLGLTPFGAEIS